MRRRTPVVLLAVGALILFGSYIWYTGRVRTELTRESEASAQVYARVYRALSDTARGAADAAILEIATSIAANGVPLMVTDRTGRITDVANLPFDLPTGDPRVADYMRALDARHAPIVLPDQRAIHFGETPFVDRLRIVPSVQAVLLVVLLLSAVAILRTHDRAERERVWAGMARESAHQLGTPLSSLHGWVELLRSRDAGNKDPALADALRHIERDIELLERVAHRFERISRPPKVESLDAADVAEEVATYFRARLPTLDQAITLDVVRGDGHAAVRGDRVLLAWAIEALVKNAVDALSGRGGRIEIRIDPAAEGGARLRVADDGPGIPRELRGRIFSAGFTTKERGWGIGLALAKRIVEDGHRGRIILAPSDRGAVFDVILPG